MPVTEVASPPRRVLVVAYYFPPMGLSGVQRVAKFVKYLPEFGWHPTVLTVSPGGYFAFDPSLETELQGRPIEVVRTHSMDPTRLFGRSNVVSMPRENVRSRLSNASQYFFIPDNKVGWYPAAVRKGLQLVRDSTFHAIVSSAPPYTAHLIAAKLKRRTKLPLLIDFRDDWVGNPRHVYPSRWHRRVHERLERRVIATCDALIAINELILDSLRSRHPDLTAGERGRVLPQGFDPEDFENSSFTTGAAETEPGKTFTLLYTGVFYDVQRPDTLFKALARIRRLNPHLASRIRLEFVGLLPDESVALARELGIHENIKYRGYLPHSETVARLMASDAVWMVIGRRPGAESISTGKMFEYFGSRKPILALVPPGTARSMLEAYGAATIVEPDDVEAVSMALTSMVEAWKKQSLPRPSDEFVSRFNRRVLTGELAHILDKLSEMHGLD